MCTKGFVVSLPLLGVVSAPALPKCQEGTAQPSVRILVTKLERAFEERDAVAMAALAGCPFSVGTSASDNITYMPSFVFAERFLGEAQALDLTLREGDMGSTYPQEPRRIFLWIGREQKLAGLSLGHDPRSVGAKHVFSFERDADGWRFTGYTTTDGGLLERLRRGYPNVLVQVKVFQFAGYLVK